MVHNYKGLHARQLAGCLLVIFIYFWGMLVPAGAQSSSFGVIPTQSANQIGNVKQGWYLKVHPGQTYQLQFQLCNYTNNTNKIQIQPLIVQTTPQLTLDTATPNAVPGPGAQYDFRQLVAGKVVQVPPGKVVAEKISLHIPAAGIKGLLMGGLLFSSQSDLQFIRAQIKKGKSSSTPAIANFSYGVYLQQDLHPQRPHFHIDQPKLTLANRQVLFKTPIKNTYAYPFLKGKFRARVTNRMNPKLNTTFVNKSGNFAGNSKTVWLNYWHRGPLSPGTYHVRYDLTHHRQHYVFHKSFTLTQKQTNELNKFLPKDPNRIWWWVFLAVLIVLGFAGLTIWVYRSGLHKGRPNVR